VTAVGTGPSIAELAGRNLGSRSVSLDASRAILYALAVGARSDELELVYERDLRPLPTLAWPLSLWAVEEAGRAGAYDPVRTLHVGQTLRAHRPLPPEGRIEMAGRVGSVYDKGSAALLEVEVESEYFETTATIFVPGAGGFGGERGSSAGPGPTGPPDDTMGVATSREQAALYRLTGDRHPLHIDPRVAADAGFERPILHGLCTLGAVCLAVARGSGRAPDAIETVEGRLAAPVYPGQELALDLWRNGAVIAFSARVDDTEVVKGGVVTFAEEAAPN
jgi:acyl dehydratase